MVTHSSRGSKLSTAKNLKVILGVGCGCATLVVAMVVGLFIYMGVKGPETFVVSGHAVTKTQMANIKNLGLIDDGETIVYFYSDAMVDIEKGMYMLTDRQLILYTKSWETPMLRIDFQDIASIHLEREESFFIDSFVQLVLTSGEEIVFPLSSEGDGDLKFVDRIKENLKKIDFEN